MITVGQSIPHYTPTGLGARDIFFRQFNQVNFYVEDEKQENFYHALLRKLFPKLRITQIFPLGGKTRVLAHAKDPTNAAHACRSVYILDKDFDDLLGQAVSMENVFYLDRYCIENYVLEARAVLEIAIESKPRSERRELAKRIDFARFISRSRTKLGPLFRLFFAVQKFRLPLPNCDCKPETFCQKRKLAQLDPNKIATYASDVRRELINRGIFASKKEVAGFLKSAFPKTGPRDANISGSFLLAMTMHYLREKISIGNISLDSLLFRLARHCSSRKLRPLQLNIERYLARQECQD